VTSFMVTLLIILFQRLDLIAQIYLLNKFWVHILNIKDLLCLLLRYLKSVQHSNDMAKCPNNNISSNILIHVFSSHLLLQNFYWDGMYNGCLQQNSQFAAFIGPVTWLPQTYMVTFQNSPTFSWSNKYKMLDIHIQCSSHF